MRGNYPLACFPAAGEKRALTYGMGRIRLEPPPPPPQRAALARGGSSRELSAALPAAPPPPPAPLSLRGVQRARGRSLPPGCSGRGARLGQGPKKSSSPLPRFWRRELNPRETAPLPGRGAEGGGPGGGVTRGTHDAGALTGAFGSGQIPGIQLKSWLAPLAGRRSRGICIMKIDSSKTARLAARPRSRRRRGTRPPRAPRPEPPVAGGAWGRTPRAAGRGAAEGAAGTCPAGGGWGGGPRVSLSLFGGGGVKPSSGEKTLSLGFFLLY